MVSILERVRNVFKFEAPIQIVMLYILSSFPMAFPSAAMAKWLWTIGSPAQVNNYYGVCFLPWSYKIAFGVLSDMFPILKRRRKPYMFIYSICAAIGQLCFALYAKTIGQAMVIGFLVNCGLAGAEVLFDSLVVEMIKQSDSRASVLQSACMQYRSMGTIIANTISLILLHYKLPEHWFIGLTAIFPLLSAIVVLTYKEMPSPGVSPKLIGTNLLTFLKSLFSKNQPLILVFLFLFSISLMPTTLEIMYNYEFSLNFTTFTVQALMFISSGGAFLGAWFFKKFSSKRKLWKTFLYTAVFSSLSGFTQLVLSQKWYEDMGVSPSVFGAVDGGIVSTFRTMAFMPVVVLASSAAPKGIEATAYAALLSSSEIASSLQDFLGGSLISHFGIDRTHWGNLWKYIVLCNILAPIPLLLLLIKPLRKLLTKSDAVAASTNNDNNTGTSSTNNDSSDGEELQPLMSMNNNTTKNNSNDDNCATPVITTPQGNNKFAAPMPAGDDSVEAPLLVSATTTTEQPQMELNSSKI